MHYTPEHLTPKEAIHEACMQEIKSRVETARSAMLEAQAAANEETKGSAGDKHETGRAMNQLEREKHAVALQQALENKEVMEHLNPLITSGTIQTGSLVETNQGLFYIGLGLGKVSNGTITAWAVSPSAPVGKQFLGKKAGDRFVMNERHYIIHQVS